MRMHIAIEYRVKTFLVTRFRPENNFGHHNFNFLNFVITLEVVSNQVQLVIPLVCCVRAGALLPFHPSPAITVENKNPNLMYLA